MGGVGVDQGIILLYEFELQLFYTGVSLDSLRSPITDPLRYHITDSLTSPTTDPLRYHITDCHRYPATLFLKYHYTYLLI